MFHVPGSPMVESRVPLVDASGHQISGTGQVAGAVGRAVGRRPYPLYPYISIKALTSHTQRMHTQLRR